MDIGAAVQRSGRYNWQSVVVLPEGSKKIRKYNRELEEGFCDLKIVPNDTDANVPDLSSIFPKVAALAGYRKDKAVKKGWIRYKNKMLIIAIGSGGMSTQGIAPKGTAYDGLGFHVPSSEILFSSHMTIKSLHELFCVVERFLQTL